MDVTGVVTTALSFSSCRWWARVLLLLCDWLLDPVARTNTAPIRDSRLPPQSKWEIHYSGVLHSVDWYLVADVSCQPLCSIFLECLTLENVPFPKTGSPKTSVN